MATALLASALLDALPQTQCRRCGYDDCRGYAEAMADGRADIDRCPPGGAEGVARLSRLTGRPLRPLDPSCGREAPRALAIVDERWCIGCALCLAACPVDAIVGAAKRMHTVVEALCTGCELCLPVCPVDCIGLTNASGDRTGWQAWSETDAAAARRRHERRLARDATHGFAPLAAEASATEASGPAASAGDATAKRDAVASALARARAARLDR